MAKLAPYYSGRVRYLPHMFKCLVEKLALGPEASVLDLCCGQGGLAKGFSPYAARIVAVDRSEAMLNYAKTESPANVHYVQADLSSAGPHDFGVFDLVTIGRALEYLPRAELLAFLDRSVRPGGAVFVGRAEIRADTPWRHEYNRIRRNYGYRGRTHARNEAKCFVDSAFTSFTSLIVSAPVPYDVDRLVADALSYESSHDAVARKREVFRAELDEVLTPYRNVDGSLTAIVGSGGLLLWR